MSHLLARLRGVKYENIREILLNDAKDHAKEGLFLEHLWQNDDDQEEVLFLFRCSDLDHVKKFIIRVHNQALKENPYANLPVITYLLEK